MYLLPAIYNSLLENRAKWARSLLRLRVIVLPLPNKHSILELTGLRRDGPMKSLPLAYRIQGSAKWWALGCVNPACWFHLAAGGEFTQPRVHLLADPCISALDGPLLCGDK